VPAPVREQSRERGDERTIGGAKPRALLLASENRELVSQEHQFHVLGELGSSIADEQPQNSGKGKVGEGKEHRPILPGPVAPLCIRVLAWISRFWYSRARVKPRKDASQDSKPPGRASQNHTGHGEGTAGRRIHARTRIGVLAPFTHLLPRFPNPGLLAQDSLRRQRVRFCALLPVGLMEGEGVTRAKIDLAADERFTSLRRALGVSSFGLNQLTLQPGQRGRIHRHREQEEVYLVLGGTLTLLVEKEELELGEGELARVPPSVRRQLVNRASAPCILVAIGGAGVHVGRDGEAFGDWDELKGRPPQEVPLPADVPHAAS
jgi:mannose-6-phosphate isomerase-like protein (cupin superfamily)